MSMYGIDPEETAETLDSSAHWDAANLMRQMATQITALETAVARVRKVTDEIDTEMRTEPETQRAAMQMEAITRIRAALDGHELHHLADQAQQPPAINAEFEEHRTTVEYFVQCQQPDGSWEQASSTTTDPDFATERLAARRRMQPDLKHRLARRTTTVVTEAQQPKED